MTTMNAEQCTQFKDGYQGFRYLDKEETSVVVGYLQCRSASAGDVLWKEGDLGDEAAFVVEGRIEVKKQTEFAGKHVIVGIYGPGSVVGEFCLLSRDPHAVTATALIDTSLLMLNHDRFEQLLEEHPDLGVKLFKGMFHAVSTRLRKSYERLASVF